MGEEPAEGVERADGRLLDEDAGQDHARGRARGRLRVDGGDAERPVVVEERAYLAREVDERRGSDAPTDTHAL